ncbi:MAG: DEAD/DEAH box helicase, partial [Bdellovibrionales bacterium]|nr:DEAD/DEAH box helicase [Bdellovibrionales bacterium]
YLLGKIPQDRQILLFSATMTFTVLNMVFEYGANPTEFNVSRDQMTADNIQQVLYHVGDNEKPRALIGVIKKYLPEGKPMMVFVNYKERVPWVAELLSRNGIPASGLSSLMRQEKRNKIIQGFRDGRFRALVATDVASRGLDIDNIGLVVNYHLPEDAPTYVHRIGRTARAGKEGIAVSIASSEDAYSQLRVEEFLGKKIPVEWFGDDDVPEKVELPESRYLRDMDEDEEGGEGRDDRHHRGPRRDGRRDGRRPRHGERRGREPRQTPIQAEKTEEQPPMHENREERGGRRERFDRREGRGGRRDGRRERSREPLPDPASMPNPLTGNPIIYDMTTGKPKNRSESEVAAMRDAADKGPAILKKLGSKVTALFGSRK